jgi:hypothetical protein
MANEVAKKQPLELDSIDDFDDSIAGGDGRQSGGGGGFLPNGVQVKFTLTERWQTKIGGVDITGKIVLHLDTIRTEVRWGTDRRPVGPPRVLGPGEQYRDVEAVNEQIPREEWLPAWEKGGPLRGPVQNQNVAVFGDLATMERCVWPSPVTTIGSAIAVRELTEPVKRMRSFRGERVFAKVALWKCRFPTHYREDQKRPHLEILGWLKPTEHGLVEIDPHLLPNLQPVSEPSLAEELKDKIKY